MIVYRDHIGWGFPYPRYYLLRGLWWQECSWKWNLTLMCVRFRSSLRTSYENSTPASEKQIVWWYLLKHTLFEAPDLITHQTPRGRSAEFFSVDQVIRDNRSSGILRSVEWQLFTDVLVQLILPVFKVQAVLSSSYPLNAWALKVEPIGFVETSVINYQSTLSKIPEEQRHILHHRASLKSRIGHTYI
jgi:hypothetical protein